MADDVRYFAPPRRREQAMACYDAVGLHVRVAALRAADAGRGAPPTTWRDVGLVAERPLPGAGLGDGDGVARLVEARSSMVLWWRPAAGGGRRLTVRRRDTWRHGPQGWRLVRRVIHAAPAVPPPWARSLLL